MEIDKSSAEVEDVVVIERAGEAVFWCEESRKPISILKRKTILTCDIRSLQVDEISRLDLYKSKKHNENRDSKACKYVSEGERKKKETYG